MTEKTYTWPEAWDLMVNHGKKLIYIKNEFITYIYFDYHKKLFMAVDDHGDVFIFDNIEGTHHLIWKEYEEPRIFEWRMDNPTYDVDIIVKFKGNKYYMITNISQGKKIEMHFNFKIYTLEDIEKWSYIPE